jgi:ABC-type multidrug transport system fused ATPase/permease subunit
LVSQSPPDRAQPTLASALLDLYRAMLPARRRQFYAVIALMLLGALAELVAVGAVVPFLSLLADPAKVEAMPAIASLFRAIGADTRPEMVTAAAAAFCAAAIIAALLRLQLSWSSQNFVFMFGHEISVEIHRRVLLQTYSYHISHNTSELISAIEKSHILVFNVLLPMMQAVIAVLMSVFIVAVLVYIDPFTAIVSLVSFGALYILVSFFWRRRLRDNSIAIDEGVRRNVQVVQESLGGIRDIIIDSSEDVFVREFTDSDRRLSIARSSNAFIGAAPRFVIEGSGMVLIAVLALVVSAREGGVGGAVPILGAVALGAQRLLPLLQQIYNGWASVAGHWDAVLDILVLLNLPVRQETPANQAPPITLRDRISVTNVQFSYPGRKEPVLRNVTLTIPSGSRVALVGKTGSGKSTLADLLMGLLEPDSGEIAVDGVPLTGETRRRWQRSIAHVPQAIFLADTTIARNIAFGSAEVDLERVKAAGRHAQLDEFVSQLPDGYDTPIGERGIRLSGGQRQRLGIARALYKGAPVVVLDEATSALDNETEAAVIRALDALGSEGRTTIMIAHRLSTVAGCDIVARLEHGRLVQVGSFEEVIGNLPKRQFAE